VILLLIWLAILLLLTGGQFLAYRYDKVGRKTAAGWALAVSLPLLSVILVFELPLQFVPAEYAEQQLRQLMFFIHVGLWGVEWVVFALALASIGVRQRSFSIAWGINLAVIVVVFCTTLMTILL
jgi:hypothetical protein